MTPKLQNPVTDKDTTHLSKFLSLILRHEPERVGIKLDSACLKPGLQGCTPPTRRLLELDEAQNNESAE